MMARAPEKAAVTNSGWVGAGIIAGLSRIPDSLIAVLGRFSIPRGNSGGDDPARRDPDDPGFCLSGGVSDSWRMAAPSIGIGAY